CWMHPTGWYSLLGKFMCYHIGLGGISFQSPDFDERYVAHLLKLLKASSLAQAVILANDQVYHADGRLMAGAGTFYVPNDYVLKLAREHSSVFLPAVSIHPARPDALEELDRCVAAGAVMMKCLPNCHNIDCNDPRYRKFWERMAELKLPLLAHTGGEHTLQIIEPKYADPLVLTLPLECGVTCIAAHCGGRGFIDPEYFHIFEEMTTRHANLYGDISAFNIPFRSKHYRAALRPLVQRLVHGSDYPVPVFTHWAWMRGLIDWPTFRRCEAIANVIERDYQIKRAIGFPEEVFTRISKLMRGRPV
ncbi:MAG: amidohydrolase family protein, partial [Verrucomicrobiota bacterium]